MNDPRGSLWNRWDLQVHTPASLVHRYPGSEHDAWEGFISDIEALPPEFKVIGVNDYLFLDGYERVLAEHQSGRMSNIALFLPLIELRLNQFGGSESSLSRVNYHVIFSNELEPSVIREQFIGALSSRFDLVPRHLGTPIESAWSGTLSREALDDLGRAIIESVPAPERHRYGPPRIEGFNNLTVSLDRVQEALESSRLRGRFVAGVGKTEWADVRWQDGSIADKKNLINSADCVFVASETASAYQRARVALTEAGVNDRLIDCSDAHHPASSSDKDRIGNTLTWIKADLTFGGLLQALQEFEQRVYIGEEPPEIRRVREHPSKYIDRVRIYKDPDSLLEEEWFDVDLPLNPGLVAIIGNKGTGKSALAEVIGLAAGSPHEDDFSFLHESKFRDPRRRLAQHFKGAIAWCDGTTDDCYLSEQVEVGADPSIQHLPQRYLETLCNEVPRGEKTQFDEELERIIFAHLPVERRLGAASLEDLIELTVRPIETELAELRASLTSVNSEIAQLEDDLRPEVRNQRLQAYHAKRREWWALHNTPPEEVPEPDETDPALESIRTLMRELAEAKGHLEARRVASESALAAVRRDQASVAALRSSLEAIQRQHAAVLLENEELITRLGLPPEFSVITLDTAVLDDCRTTLAEREGVLARELGGEDERGLTGVVEWLDEEIGRLSGELSAPEERREGYLTRLRSWEAEVAALLGSHDVAESALGARAALHELSQIPARLEKLRERRLEQSGEIHQLLMGLAEVTAALYAPLQGYMDDQPIPSEYMLSIGTSLVDTSFGDVLLEEMINRNISGSFCGVEQSLTRVAELLSETDFDSKASALRFLGQIDDHFRFDRREDPAPQLTPSTQVRQGKSIVEVYDFVFGLSYLSPRYGLRFGGNPIYQLSPGEKGTLLLIFFLLAELDTRPLVIDQPEDNLDNNTVYRALVSCFQRAKERRQVIIVTHNPNLAVVCDADQIIVATMDKRGLSRIDYDPGAIERRETVRAVVDILEGTQPAFDNRSVKYTLHLLDLA